MARRGSMNPRVVGVAALLGALFFLFSMNSRGPAEAPHQLSSQLYGELRSIQARWGSGGEATVLKEEVAGLHKRIADLERHQEHENLAVGSASHLRLQKSAMVSNAERHAAPAASAFEPLCQVTFGRKLCMRGGQEEACPGAVDIDRRDGAVPTASGAWRLQATNYTYFMDRGLVAALAKQFAGGSVLELGAGKGCYSAALKRTGLMTGVRAIDGAPGVAEMTGGLVHTADLTTELQLGAADWVLCLEVAEHVPRAFEERLLANWDRHNRRGIVMSWSDNAGGNGHVNIRSNEWVLKRMAAMGYEHDKQAQETLRRSVTDIHWFRTTLMVFTKKAGAAA